MQKLLAENGQKIALIQDLQLALHTACVADADAAPEYFNTLWLCDACDLDQDAPASAFQLALEQLDAAASDLCR